MFQEIVAIRYKRYKGMMTKNVTHLFRHECLMLCYLWKDGVLPPKDKLRGKEADRILGLFEYALDQHDVKWKLFDCKSRFNVQNDDYRYTFTGFRLLPAGMRLALMFPSNQTSSPEFS
jgi:hypothetical protein